MVLRLAESMELSLREGNALLHTAGFAPVFTESQFDEEVLAKAFGARVIATTGSDEKGERLLALGADDVINYRTMPAWSERVRDLTGGRGADHVIVVVGTLEQAARSVAIEGEIAFVGFLGREDGLLPIDPRVLWTSALTLRAIAARFASRWTRVTRRRQQRVRRLTDEFRRRRRSYIA
jgi:NADPH:quinone reductase-like Zn-dependent oxidoreductase